MIKPVWSDELNRINRALRDLTASPLLEALREIERQRPLLEAPGLRMLRDLTAASPLEALREVERQRPLREAPGSRALRELQESPTGFRKLSETLTLDASSINRAARDLEVRNVAAARRVSETLAADFSSIIGRFETLKVVAAMSLPENLAADLQRALQAFRIPALPALASYADQLRSIPQNFDALRQFQDAFAGRLLDATYALANAPEGEVDERAQELAAFLGTHLSKSSGGLVSFDGFLQIVLALFLSLLSASGTRQSEERIMGHLSNITAQLQELGAGEQVNPSPELRLVTAASLRIRSEPSGTSEVIGKLTRGALVRVISKEKRWAQVEYFDFVKGGTATGWVAHRFLQTLPDEFSQDDAPDRNTEAEARRACERFERHFGEVDLGYATGADNVQIDADLAREYEATDQPN